MRPRRCCAILSLAAALLPQRLVAQTRLGLGPQGMVSTEPAVAFVAGAGGFLQVGRRDRLAGFAGIGREDQSRGAGRVELTWQVVLVPEARRVTAYAGAGVGHRWGRLDQGILVVLLGLEGNPAGQAGWIAELGLGGGVRVSLGYRRRWGRRTP